MILKTKCFPISTCGVFESTFYGSTRQCHVPVGRFHTFIVVELGFFEYSINVRKSYITDRECTRRSAERASHATDYFLPPLPFPLPTPEPHPFARLKRAKRSLRVCTTPFLGSSYVSTNPAPRLRILTLVPDQRADNCGEPPPISGWNVPHVIAHLRGRKIGYLSTRYIYDL